MLCGVTVGDLDMDARMLLGKVTQQVGEKAGCQRGENPYAQMAFLTAPDRVHDLCAFVDVAKDLSRLRQQPLPCDGQAHAAAMALKQRGPEPIFHVANPATDRGLLHTERCTRLPKASMLESCNEVSQMSKIHTCTWRSSGGLLLSRMLDRDVTLRGLPKRFSPRGDKVRRRSPATPGNADQQSLYGFLYESKCISILDQRPNLGAIETVRHFGVNLEADLHPAARQRGELLDDRFDDLMDVSGRTIRRDHHGAGETRRLLFLLRCRGHAVRGLPIGHRRAVAGSRDSVAGPRLHGHRTMRLDHLRPHDDAIAVDHDHGAYRALDR